MRVLLVGHTYVVNTNRGKLDYLSRFPDVELTVIVPRRWPHSLKVFEAEGATSPHFDLRILGTCAEGRETRYVYFPCITLGIGRLRPDIVHVEDGPWSLVCLQALISGRVLAPDAKGLFFTWWNMEYELSPSARAIERLNFACSDWAIAGNQDAAGLLKQHGFEGGVSVLPQLGVDPDLYRPSDRLPLRSRLGLKDEFVVGFVGRVSWQKGVDTLLEAFADLNGNPHLVCVGKGDLSACLERRAEEIGVRSRVSLLGVVPHDEVPTYMSMFDALVLPSRTTPHWKEQFGHVLVEAMACETPVIGSDSGEIPNVIGDAGMIFPEGNSQALASSLNLLMGDAELRRDLARRGRQRVLQRYTNERIARETYEIYCHLVGQRTSNA